MEMTERDNLRYRKIPPKNGTGMPALGFGTLISDPITTKNATKAALEDDFVNSIPQNDTEGPRDENRKVIYDECI
jgi:hypothetical protein